MRCAWIIDVYSRGTYHEVINQVYLMAVARLYDQVTYIAAASSCRNLRQLLDAVAFDYSNVRWEEKQFASDEIKPLGTNKIGERIKYSWLKYWYYLQSPKGTDVFYNNNLFLAIPLIQYLAWGKDNRVFSLLHGEMEVIDPAKATTTGKRISSRFFRWVFGSTRLSSRMQFIVLSKSMQDYFCGQISPVNHAHIHWMDHGYIRPANPLVGKVSLPTDEPGILKVGLPSILNADHGMDLVRQLLSRLTDNPLRLYGISRVEGKIEDLHFVQLSPNDSYLPFAEYNAYVCEMDVLLFPYKTDSYRMAASGAALEAIWNGKPIVAMQTPYFSYLFERFGPMGILCNDEEELLAALLAWSQLPAQQIQEFTENLKTARESLSPTAIQQQLSHIVS